jgi:hypothetical protein
MRNHEPVAVGRGVAMSPLRIWPVVTAAAVALIGFGLVWFVADGKPEVAPGVCVVLASDSNVSVVGCDDPDAEFKVVSFAGVSTPDAPAECEIGEPYAIFLPGENGSAKPAWCLVGADDDSAEVQDDIHEARAG